MHLSITIWVKILVTVWYEIRVKLTMKKFYGLFLPYYPSLIWDYLPLLHYLMNYLRSSFYISKQRKHH